MINNEDCILADLKYLCESIGPRPSFTPANQAAARYISRRMLSLGLIMETQSFSCPIWECSRAELQVGGDDFEILPNPYSPSCNIQAKLVSAGTLDELENLAAGDQILVLYGELTLTPIACKSWFLKDARDERIVELLEKLSPAALLTVQSQPGSINRIIEDAELHIPSATLPAVSALKLIARVRENAHMRLETQTQAGSTANIIGRVPGVESAGRVVLCAHYDTKIDTPGALDNASGVACLLAIAERLASEPMSVGLEFVAFTNEEYLPIGDDVYLEKAGEGFLANVHMAINFDGLGHRIGVNTLAIFKASDEFKACVETIKIKYPAVQWVDPWPQSNHSTFAMRGVPALAFSSSAAWSYAHQLDDGVDRVSVARVDEAARLAAEVIRAVQTVPLTWLRSVA